MDTNQAAEFLRQAENTTHKGRQAGKWFAIYLAIFGVASIPLSLLVGWSAGRPALLMPVMIGWIVLVAAAAIWSTRQRGALKATKQVSGFAFAAWGLAWGITVVLGATFFTGSLLWWLGGGIVMAAIMFTAAALTARQVQGTA